MTASSFASSVSPRFLRATSWWLRHASLFGKHRQEATEYPWGAMTDSPVVLYRASDRVEASLLAHALASAGIRVDLAGGNSNLIYGEVGAAEALQTELWVRPEDLSEGRKVIERYQQRVPVDSTSSSEPWVCAGCGEANEPTFDVCWQCQRSRAG